MLLTHFWPHPVRVPPHGLRRAIVTVKRQCQRRPCVLFDRLHPIVELDAGQVVIEIER